ncbi:hypothetical protein [Beijerinckia indica]|uniref:Uncharacterized protein n=1 Tax=Beijerinckia indica subsp. indica (strain ATCC 9039 / DSM 1715 / NCIMB 8712) TaxID=395963 RepID=B2IHN1_BEII9|nr:hypothetical protein [Beijerinckia indica]ACB94552.1 hypothetical protein Bind_0903 [Beijerinckia indica subsp. indica ATCC 9039]
MSYPSRSAGNRIRLCQSGLAAAKTRAFLDFVMEAFRHKWLAKRSAGSLG